MTETLRLYLLGHKCIVYTDNNPLSHLSSTKLGATKQRWTAQLAAFDFELKYSQAGVIGTQTPFHVSNHLAL